MEEYDRINSYLHQKTIQYMICCCYQCIVTINKAMLLLQVIVMLLLTAGNLLCCALVDLSTCDYRWSHQVVEDALVTFIIPSIARQSLRDALVSIQRQTDDRWLVLVIFDGLLSSSLYLNKTSRLPVYYTDLDSSLLSDQRICIVHTHRSRRANCGAEKRNLGVSLVKTVWAGFVDDDDTVDQHYVSHLASHTEVESSACCILFRMCDKEYGGRVVPAFDSHTFYRQEVGISFAVQTRVFRQWNYSFEASNWEDFLFLDRLRADQIPIYLSPHVAYYVRGYSNPLTCQHRLSSSILSTIGHGLITNSSSNLLLRRAPQMSKRQIQQELSTAKLHDCSQRGSGSHKPVFFVSDTEANSAFFSSNVLGLQQMLQRAMDVGCHGHWLNMPEVRIQIVFGAETEPESEYFIQLQLEQQTSAFLTSPKYQTKLKKALQVWQFDFNLSSDSKVARNLHSQNEQQLFDLNYEHEPPTYFVPTMLSLAWNIPDYYTCSNSYSDEVPIVPEEQNKWEVKFLTSSATSSPSIVTSSSMTAFQPSTPSASASRLRARPKHTQNNNQKKSTETHTFWVYHSGNYHQCRLTHPTLPPSPSSASHKSSSSWCSRQQLTMQWLKSEVSPCTQRSLAHCNQDDDYYCWFTPYHQYFQSPHRQQLTAGNNPSGLQNHTQNQQNEVAAEGETQCQRVLSSLLSHPPQPIPANCHDHNMNNRIEVLVFGKLRGSFQNQRERLCDRLQSSSLNIHNNNNKNDQKVNVLCVEGVFGALQQRLVCNARIVVVPHYYQNSALETHRLDPLLQAGRLVLFQTSRFRNSDVQSKSKISTVLSSATVSSLSPSFSLIELLYTHYSLPPNTYCNVDTMNDDADGFDDNVIQVDDYYDQTKPVDEIELLVMRTRRLLQCLQHSRQQQQNNRYHHPFASLLSTSAANNDYDAGIDTKYSRHQKHISNKYSSSSSSKMDRAYHKNSHQKLPFFSLHRRQVEQFVKQMGYRNLDPLCLALSQLQPHLLQRIAETKHRTSQAQHINSFRMMNYFGIYGDKSNYLYVSPSIFGLLFTVVSMLLLLFVVVVWMVRVCRSSPALHYSNNNKRHI